MPRGRSNSMVDPTPEELAAACAAIPGRTSKRTGERMPEQHMHAPFYAWLYDPEAVLPLAVAVPDRSEE